MLRDDPQERIFFSRPPSLPGVEIMSVYGSGQPWHVFHERYAICACNTAAAAYTYRGDEHLLRDGSIAFMEPGEAHRNTRVDKRSDFKVLFIDPDTFVSTALERSRNAAAPHFRRPLTEERRLFSLLYGLCRSVESGAEALEQQSRFTECAQMLLRYCEARPAANGCPDSVAVAKAYDYLLAHYNHPVTLSELAAVAHVSGFHLLRAFSRRYGIPPHAFQVHVRVERAAALLRRSFLPSAVATAVGFADQSHLNRHFKRVFHTTPSAYARSA